MSAHEQLKQLERAMWTTATRGDRTWIDAHLSPTFTEFGRSGRACTRDEILDQPVGDIAAVLSALTVREFAPDVSRVTYRTLNDRQPAHRASIWIRQGDRWLLDFHQGTPTNP